MSLIKTSDWISKRNSTNTLVNKLKNGYGKDYGTISLSYTGLIKASNINQIGIKLKDLENYLSQEKITCTCNYVCSCDHYCACNSVYTT